MKIIGGTRRRALRATALATGFTLALGLAMVPAGAASSSGHASTITHRAATAAAAVVRPQLSTGPGAAGRPVRYAVARQVCGRARAGLLSCDSIKLVPSAKGARGARAYAAPAYTTGPAGGYTPADLASAYRYNPKASVNQTIAIVDAYDDPHALSDLNAFDAHYGLAKETSTSFRKLNQNGKTSPLPSANADWSGEIALDVESARAVCNKCKIILIEANQPTGADLAAGVNTAARLHATEISNSYGGPETSSDNSATIAAAYNHPGIVITASTGDNGWFDWDYMNDGLGASDNAPNTPAAYSTVVAVGGTALGLNTNGTRNAEDVWNENGLDDQDGVLYGQPLGASGGGCSTRYAAPSFQAHVAGYANTGCGSKRMVGDVAADADPATGFDVYLTYGGTGWVTIGGTSLSSPLIASMWALAGGSGGVRYPAQSLYDNLRFRPSSRYDVRVGGNSFCGGDSTTNCSAVLEGETTPPTGNPNNLVDSQGNWLGMLDCSYPAHDASGTIAANKQCNATTGYDGPSGVGTPNGLTLFKPTHPTIAVGRPAVVKLHTAQNWTAAHFADPAPGGVAKHYAWNWGDGTTSSSTHATVTHRFSKAGAHKVSVTVTDSYGQTGAATLTITVGVRPAVSIKGPATVKVRSTHTWTASTSDKNTGGKIVAWSWKIGSSSLGTHASMSHRFTSVGKRTLVLTVTDNAGLRASRSIVVNVTH